MVNKKILIGIIAIIAIVAVIGGVYFVTQTQNLTQSQNSIHIDAGYITMSAGHALIFIAKEKGYFADEGLDVNVLEFTTANDELNALASDKIDVAVAGIGEPLIQMDNGRNYTFIGGVDNGDHAIIAKNESISENLRSNPENYKKYKIGTVSGIPAEIIILGYLKENANIDKNDLEIVEFKTAPDVVNGIKSGKVDVGLVYPAFQYSAEKEGLSIVNFTDELMPSLPDCRIAINAKDVNNQTERQWINYTKALIKAYDFYKTNHNETLDIVKKYVPIEGDELEISTYNDHLVLNTDPNEKGTIKFYDVLEEIGYVDGNVNVADHFNLIIYKTALDEILKEEPNNQNYLFLKGLFENQNPQTS
ncbi:ABC transporter substrate-binding protein [Methanobrevibacter curvatus]|uniref:NMT1/THI5 like protein n=1 Tax=Methanobrevibacter curvatus TaxID=49547 RepID=A0A165YWY5_9EURY|nr:ABC transporter substrate-binding protein [Methanobrevibacter curvatus]KZX09964.1 NMT1/THI5 like protein [Methanobrevibacter curvatus]